MKAKPVGRKLGWKIVESTRPYTNPWIKLRSDRLEVAGRGPVQYSYLEHPGGVMIVPVTAGGGMILIRQYRYPVDAWCLEVPAGGLHENASVTATARKELAEEAGATCGRLQKVSRFYVSNSMMDEVGHVVIAWDTVLGPRQELERAEFIQRVPLSAKKAVAMARTGKVNDAKSALAILMSEPYLKKKGFL